jgi:hypothetical protein
MPESQISGIVEKIKVKEKLDIKIIKFKDAFSEIESNPTYLFDMKKSNPATVFVILDSS